MSAHRGGAIAKPNPGSKSHPPTSLARRVRIILRMLICSYLLFSCLTLCWRRGVKERGPYAMLYALLMGYIHKQVLLNDSNCNQMRPNDSTWSQMLPSSSTLKCQQMFPNTPKCLQKLTNTSNALKCFQMISNAPILQQVHSNPRNPQTQAHKRKHTNAKQQ